MRTAVSDLEPEARFLYQEVEVEILRAPEPWRDMFGQPMLRFWARRSDTNAEGWMVFGPNASIELLGES